MDADYTAWVSAVAAFSAVVCWTNHFVYCDNGKSIEKRRFTASNCLAPTARIGNLFLVLHKCNIWIYFLLLLTQVDFFGTTFYFLESRKFLHYYFLKSRIFGMYFYYLESSKVIYLWQHWVLLGGITERYSINTMIHNFWDARMLAAWWCKKAQNDRFTDVAQ